MDNATILSHIIKTRRSIFPAQYTGEAISDAVLKQIVSAADYAPTHKKTYPWRLKVFKNEEKNALATEMMRLYRENTPEDKFSEKKCSEIGEKVAKSDVVITISINFSGLVPQWEEIAATAMAVQNMHLTCTANEVGCYWGTPSFAPLLKSFLALEPHQECYGLFFMGKM